MNKLLKFLAFAAPFYLAGAAAIAQSANERQLELTGDLLILPVSDRSMGPEGKADAAMIEVFVNDTLIHRGHAVHPRKLDDTRFWAFLDMKEYKGKTALLKLHKARNSEIDEDRVKEILSRVESSDKMRHLQPVYKEEGRPQFHFSQIQGWNNDPNGMVYADGLYHISWQCNPLEVYFGGWYWGHAVSEDLIHWREGPRTLRPNGGKNTSRYPGMADGKCFSGGSAIDHNNTLGKQVGEQKTIITTYTDHPFGESIAYSTDGGFRYTSMEDINNIIVHPKPEGVKGGGSWGRDPKPFWHEPTKKWIIVTYRQGFNPHACSGHMVFYSSSDLKEWKFESITEKLFPEDYEKQEDKRDQLKKDFHECPEFVELPIDGDNNNKKWLLLDASPKYQIGSFDGKKFTPDTKDYKWSIFGQMKAGQCFSNAPDGRAIFMIWTRMGYGDKTPFSQGFTLPLELSLRTASDGVRMYVNPVKELEELRSKEIFSAENKALSGESTVSFNTQEELVEIVVSVITASKKGSIELKFGENNLFYYLDKKQLSERGFLQHERDHVIVHDKEDGKVDFRLYLDRATWEVFVENGSVYKVGSRRDMAKPIGKISVGFREAEGTVESMKVYKLKSIWPENVDTLHYPETGR
jgi:fructan beta-fructosidase